MDWQKEAEELADAIRDIIGSVHYELGKLTEKLQEYDAKCMALEEKSRAEKAAGRPRDGRERNEVPT